jgi:hypothetical protein
MSFRISDLNVNGVINAGSTITAGGSIYAVGSLYINDTNTRLTEGNADSLRVQTSTGYVDIGSMNSSWIHFQADRQVYMWANGGAFSFDANVVPYSDNARSLGSTSARWASVNAVGATIGRVVLDYDGTDSWFRMQSGNRMRITTTGGTDFIIPNTGNMTYNGNVVLHAGNYTSYALRWNSTSAPTSGLDNTTIVPNSVTLFDGYGAPVPGYPAGAAQWWVGALTIGDANRGFQMAGGYADSDMYFRKGSGSWSSWRKVWTDSNLTNLNQLTNGPGYITSESDTLATVTSRGATTTNSITVNGLTTTTGYVRSNNPIYNLTVSGSAQNVWGKRILLSEDYYGNDGLIPYGSGLDKNTVWVHDYTASRKHGIVVSADNNGEAHFYAVDFANSTGSSTIGGTAGGWGFNIYYDGVSSDPFNLRIGQAGTWTHALKISFSRDIQWQNINSFTINGNNVWHAGNLTNLNQLTNGPGYITSAGTSAYANRLSSVSISNLNTDRTPGSLEYYDKSGGTGAPSDNWHSYISTRHGNSANQYGFQLSNQFGTESLFFRGWDGSNPLSWRTIVHSGNIGSYALTSLPAHNHDASNITSGTLANARTTASSANGSDTIVLRNSSGYFDAEGIGINKYLFIGGYRTYGLGGLGANATQARRYEIARLGIDYNDWNSVGTFEVELHEGYFSTGLKKVYNIWYGYVSNSGLRLVEYRGAGSNNFRVVIGGEVVVSGDHRYLPVYVEVKDYSSCNVVIKTNRSITGNSNSGIGSTYIFTSPSGTDIASFSADSTPEITTSSSATIGGNTVYHTGNLTNLNQLTNGPGYISANSTVSGWIAFQSNTQGTPIVKALQQDTSSGYYLFQGVTGSSEVFRVERTGTIVTSGSLVNNIDGAVIMESNASENNNWLWKENAKQWGIFWFNRGTQSGQTIGTYTTVGAEVMYMGGSSGIGMPSGWTGYTAGSNIAAMISNYNGYIYAHGTIFANGRFETRDGLYFERGSNSFTTFIRSGNHPDQGYTGSADKYWVELGSYGGTHVVLNMDGAKNSGENGFDHFTIWQAASNSTSGSRQFYVTNIGNVWARNDITAFSDIRVKENIRPIDNALNKVLNSRGVMYDRIDTGEKNGIGFIAQELELEIPDLVKTDDRGMKSVKYQNMVAVLTEAVKEQQKQIEELKNKLDAFTK